MVIENIFNKGNGDIVLVTTLSILLLMSIASWSIAILKWLKFRSAKKGNQQFLYLVKQSDSLATALNKARKLDAPMPDLTVSVLTAKEDYGSLVKLQKQVSFDEFISRKIKKNITKGMQPYNAWLGVLASIGSMAPFIGLFGTVIGIYHALISISAVGQVSIAEVSGPIGEALIATAFGLFVAVPAVMFYNVFIHQSKKLALQLGEFADDLRTKVESEGDL